MDDNLSKTKQVLADVFASHTDMFREFHLYSLRDVHGYYRLAVDPSKVIHIQAYPSLSDITNMKVFSRLMNYDKLIGSWRGARTYIGNETGAVIQEFPDFQDGVSIPWDPEHLYRMLAENVEELR